MRRKRGGEGKGGEEVGGEGEEGVEETTNKYERKETSAMCSNLGTLLGMCPASGSGLFICGKRTSCIHLVVGWVNPRAGLVAVEKSFSSLPGIETQFPYLPARSLVITSTELYRRL